MVGSLKQTELKGKTAGNRSHPEPQMLIVKG